MKRILILFGFLPWLFFSQTVAGSGLMFNVLATGNKANLSITLCLNGNGPLSCQNYAVNAVDLHISTTIPNHTYPAVGIKVNTPGYVLTGCTLSNTGYCTFSASNAASTSITVASAGAIDYQLVTVGNPGNASDTNSFGGVAYAYKIGKFDVTIGQYATFLNAVAAIDTYLLYNTYMSTDLNSAGISRSGSSGSYKYSVINNDGSSANRPITYVTWFDAARFANWMANGQPSGAQDSETTENGAYALNGEVSGLAVAKNTINPNTGEPPTFYIPLENEWYKAAYYSPTLNGGAGGYYLYATQSDTAPGNVIGSSPNQANYFATVFSVTRSPDYLATQNYLTDVGAFTGSGSFYGTFDQNGNVWQWNDLDGLPGAFRGIRGGYWFSGSTPLQRIHFSTDVLTRGDSGLGFRLASPQ